MPATVTIVAQAAPLKNFRLAGAGIDVASVLGDLDAHPDLWGQIPNRTAFAGSPHAESTDIWVRYGDISEAQRTGDWSLMREPHDAIWYPAWNALTSLHKIVADLVERVDGKRVGGIWITRIPPGKGIKRHADFGWHCDVFDKYYLALQSDAGSVFGCERNGVTEEIETVPGTAWLMDNHHPHWVKNHSARDRIMLIVCIETDKFNAFHGRGADAHR